MSSLDKLEGLNGLSLTPPPPLDSEPGLDRVAECGRDPSGMGGGLKYSGGGPDNIRNVPVDYEKERERKRERERER